MSRGPGHVQQTILRAVSDATAADRLTVEALRWSTCELQVPDGGQLPAAWNTSFRRAIDGLVESGRIAVNSRRLRTFEECVAHYPGKTLSARARSLRLRFLPLLLEWSNEADGLEPKYDRDDNELHHVELLRKNRGAFENFTAEWQLIENKLRILYGAAAEEPRNVLRLICKGRSLFGARDVDTTASFSDLVRWVCDQESFPADLATELQEFRERFISTTRADTLKLRSFVHALADVPSRGQCKLRAETLRYLHQREREFVEAMPGSRPRKARFPVEWRIEKPQFDYAPELEKLIDHTVFQSFDFIAHN